MKIILPENAKVGIVGCSNGQPVSNKKIITDLEETLQSMGLQPLFSEHIFAKDSVFSAAGKLRAEALMQFYQDEDIKVIFDVSGGDIANELLPYLDYEIIEKSEKLFWGYSDLTTIINAIYTMTERPSVLYQVKNLVYEDSKEQIENFKNSVLGKNRYEYGLQNENGKEISKESSLFSFSYHFVQKGRMQGILVGGNIRCLLKLAGTPYFPDMSNKVLLLEANSGDVPQMVTYLNQLKQMNVFEKINGILLGTFTAMEKKQCNPDIITLVKEYAGKEIPIAVTNEIGHGTNAKAVFIGKEIVL